MATSHTTPDKRGRRTGDRGKLGGAEPPTEATPTTAPGHPGAAVHDIKPTDQRRAWPDQPDRPATPRTLFAPPGAPALVQEGAEENLAGVLVEDVMTLDAAPRLGTT